MLRYLLVRNRYTDLLEGKAICQNQMCRNQMLSQAEVTIHYIAFSRFSPCFL